MVTRYTNSSNQHYIALRLFLLIVFLLAFILRAGTAFANASTDPTIELGISEYSNIDTGDSTAKSERITKASISTTDHSKGPIEINRFEGSKDDPNSRIFPFKKMQTTQPYDNGNNTLVYMQLWGESEDALWGGYDFGKSIAAGMRNNSIPYSDDFGFVETVSYWHVNHMVAPKEDALKCGECHSKDGRLAHLEDIYMPGRGDKQLLDLLGMLAVFGTLASVVGHCAIRSFTGKMRNK